MCFLCLIIYCFMKQAWVKWSEAFISLESLLNLCCMKEKLNALLSNIPSTGKFSCAFLSYPLSQLKLLTPLPSTGARNTVGGNNTSKKGQVKIGLDNLRENNQTAIPWCSTQTILMGLYTSLPIQSPQPEFPYLSIVDSHLQAGYLGLV